MTKKETYFYQCDCCGHKGANKTQICTQCNTPLNLDDVINYHQSLQDSIIMGDPHYSRSNFNKRCNEIFIFNKEE